MLLRSVVDGRGTINTVRSYLRVHEMRLLQLDKGVRDIKNRTKIHGKSDFIIIVFHRVTSLLLKCTLLTGDEIFTNYN